MFLLPYHLAAFLYRRMGFSPPKHQSIQSRLKLRHSRESGNLELLNFQTTFEYCRRPKV
ncbi:hypothetical protein NEILACOT_04228 [Neisseria lactamica ATCC 23970]|uniref:Uncharacterized protein n=1 Tax=Neisseria lactamica ATCC 23970 TaxID=546265 RepID=D0W9L6_NEILA|nr:hypothetical protein NEILACOT_04228 [Neisseria lactamica ATCC 23970]